MIDILNLQMPNSDRDLHIVAPVVEYLSVKYKLKIVSENINNGFFALAAYRPRLLLMANPYGQEETLELLKHAHQLGVRSVTMVAEGNFDREQVAAYLWGWNKDQRLWEDAMLLWSEKSRQYAIEVFPETAPKLKVCGGVGFDRYQLLNFMTKDEFLQNRSKKKKVVGIAGWGSFPPLLDSEYVKEHRQTFYGKWSDQKIAMHLDDLKTLRSLYRNLIVNNPDIEFILRMHPTALRLDQTEFLDCAGLPNVFISNQHEPETLNISDVISASDIWLAYESGTAIEAWLLGKQSVLVNPNVFDLREETHEGSPQVRTLGELQATLDAFFETGSAPGFAELAQKRETIISRVAGFSDGKSHVRAAEIVLDQYNQAKRPGLDFYRRFPYKRLIWQFSRYLIFPTWIYRKLRGDTGAMWFRKDPRESDKVRAIYREALMRRASVQSRFDQKRSWDKPHVPPRDTGVSGLQIGAAASTQSTD
jgi:hypothetical protein